MAYRSESKNFFYDIKISTPDGKKSARLTDNILALCNSATIMEAVASEEEGAGASSLTLSFIEADFLPDELDKTPAEGVAGRGYITNRTGALIDLRFDSEKGFTYITPQELQSGLSDSSRTKSRTSENVSFLFSSNNIIEITWGHLEPRTSRTRLFKIGTVTYGTGAGGNTLGIQAFTLQKDLARIKLDEGKVWTDNEGKPLSLKQVLYSIAYVFGARLDFDDSIVTDRPVVIPSEYKLERTLVGSDTKVSTDGTPLYLLRGQSIDFYLKDLARQFNSTYEIFQDPILGSTNDSTQQGIPVLKFTSEAIRYKKVIQTLTYRDPNGTMLDFQYNTIAGEVARESSTSSVGESGKAESETLTTKLTDARAVQTPPKIPDSIPFVYQDRADTEWQRDLVGTSITTPSTSRDSITSEAQLASIRNSFVGFITVKMVGHPDFYPNVYNIQGVGVRASTTYRFFQVEHSLSASGYVCTMQGKTQEVVDQGTTNSAVLEKNEDYLIFPLVNPGA